MAFVATVLSVIPLRIRGMRVSWRTKTRKQFSLSSVLTSTAFSFQPRDQHSLGLPAQHGVLLAVVLSCLDAAEVSAFFYLDSQL